MSERIVSGSVKADGSVLRGQGFHVSRTSAGRYLIVFQPPLISVADGMTQLIGEPRHSGCQACVASVDGVHAAISIETPSGAPGMRHVDCDFSFVFSGHEHAMAERLPACGVDPTQVLPEPAIGSPARSQPVIPFPRQPRHDAATAHNPDVEIPETSYTAQVERLKQMMQQVLKPLQRENRMLKSRLDISARQANGGRRIELAPDRFPDMRGGALLSRLLTEHPFAAVLDAGPVDLQRLAVLTQAGGHVTAVVDHDVSSIASPNVTLLPRLPQDADGGFGCIVAIDALQRQRDPQDFLRRLRGCLAEGGLLALSVPALRFPLTTGDLTIWSSGLILYHLAAAGFDCRKIRLVTQGEEILVLLVKHSIPGVSGETLPAIDALRPHLPASLEYVETPEGLAIDGDIHEIGWFA